MLATFAERYDDKMKRMIKLINDERIKAGLASQKGCTVGATDTCYSFDQADCTAKAYDACEKDYAGCSGEETNDICSVDYAACFNGYDDVCSTDNRACYISNDYVSEP